MLLVMEFCQDVCAGLQTAGFHRRGAITLAHRLLRASTACLWAAWTQELSEPHEQWSEPSHGRRKCLRLRLRLPFSPRECQLMTPRRPTLHSSVQLGCWLQHPSRICGLLRLGIATRGTPTSRNRGWPASRYSCGHWPPPRIATRILGSRRWPCSAELRGQGRPLAAHHSKRSCRWALLAPLRHFCWQRRSKSEACFWRPFFRRTPGALRLKC